jgi:replicative DNA helicase
MISFELSEEFLHKRFTTMVTGINSRDLHSNVDEAVIRIRQAKQKLKKGSLFLKHMPVGTNSSQIRAFLREFELQHGFLPDVLVIDYLDLMKPNERISADNVFERDKLATEQLREIIIDNNMILITSSQQNRGGVNAVEIDHSHIAGGISKINTTDIAASILFSEHYKIQGILGLKLIKTRSSDGVGQHIFLGWDGDRLRVVDRDFDPNDPIIKRLQQDKDKSKQENKSIQFNPAITTTTKKTKKASILDSFAFDELDMGD